MSSWLRLTEQVALNLAAALHMLLKEAVAFAKLVLAGVESFCHEAVYDDRVQRLAVR